MMDTDPPQVAPSTPAPDVPGPARRWAWAWGPAATFGSGALFGVVWIAPSLAAAAWPALAVLVGLIDRCSARSAFFRAWCFGSITHLIAFYWIAEVVDRFSTLPYWLAVVTLVVYCAFGGLQFAFFGMLTVICRPPRGTGVLHFPVIWVALEMIWFKLFPWSLAHTQVNWTGLVQIAEWTGVHGVSFLIMWGAALMVRAFDGIRRGGGVRRNGTTHAPLPRQVAAYVMVLAACLAFGYWRIARVEAYLANRPETRVALVQPGEQDERRFSACLHQTLSIEEPVDLVCWPESAVGAQSLAATRLRHGPYLSVIDRQWSKRSPTRPWHLLCGGHGVEKSAAGDSIYYVSAFAADAKGTLLGHYHKRRLVPFGEYIPGQDRWPALGKLIPQMVRLHPGTSPEPIEIPGRARVGVLICYEDVFADLARDAVRGGADVLVNLTHDVWFGRTAALGQHERLARLRAVETRRYLLRCTTTGATVVVDPVGRVVAQVPLYQPDTLVATIHTSDIRTFHTAWGNVFGWACTGLTALLLLRAIHIVWKVPTAPP